jgi:Uncharacterized protein conserved in bacteria
MKQCFSYILVFLFSLTCMAQSSENLFQSANSQYSKKQYQQALTKYQKIEKQGAVSPLLYYNMGNTYFRLSDYASAELYYERGLRLSPNDDNLNTNLKVVKARLKGDIYPIGDFVIVRYWYALSNLFTPFAWLWISVGLFVLCCGGFSIYYFAFQYKVLSFYAFLALLLIFVLSVFCGISRDNRLHNHNEAIVFAEQCSGKDSPDEKALDKVRIYKGSKVKIIDKDAEAKEWIRVQTTDGQQSWIRLADIQII